MILQEFNQRDYEYIVKEVNVVPTSSYNQHVL